MFESNDPLGNTVCQDLYEGDRSILGSLGLVRRQLLQLAALDSKLVALPDAVDASLTGVNP